MPYSGAPPASVNSAGIVDGSVVDADVNAAAAIAESKISGLVADLALKAPLADPVFTGNPTAPTPTAEDNDTSIATTAFARSLREPNFLLANGNWATGDNYSAGNTKAFATQALRLRYFTARSATPITSVATLVQVVGSVDASVARIGIWDLGVNGIDLNSLVAYTDHDAALWRTLGKRTKALHASWTPVVGQRYAVGVLVVQASGTLPSLMFVAGLLNSNIGIEATAANVAATGQADLPASLAVASMVGIDSGPYVEFIP